MKTPLWLPALLLIALLCVNETTSYAKELSLQLGNIQDITVLAHPVCSFRLQTEKNLDHAFFAEGDICPLGGAECEYHALININGKDMKLRKLSLKHKSAKARFKSGDTEIEVHYGQTRCFPDRDQCDSSVLDATVTVVQGQKEKQIKAIGECGD